VPRQEKKLRSAARILVVLNLTILTVGIALYKMTLNLWDHFRDDIALSLAVCFFLLIGIAVATSRSRDSSQSLLTRQNGLGAALIVADGLLLLVLGAGQ
jgi:hypothetical protein